MKLSKDVGERVAFQPKKGAMDVVSTSDGYFRNSSLVADDRQNVYNRTRMRRMQRSAAAGVTKAFMIMP